MAYNDEEEKRRRAQERKAVAQQYEKKREELLRKNAEMNAIKPAQNNAGSLSGGATKHSATAASVNASAVGYQKRNRGDNDMAKVVASYRQETPDIASMTYDQAMGFATRIVYDDERDDFLKKWQKSAKKQTGSAPSMDDMHAHLNSQVPGGLYRESKDAYTKQVQENFKNEYAVNKSMKAFAGLTDMAGNAVNMNTAPVSDILRSIRSVASEKRRDAYIEAFDTLTKTPGSRFYGVEYDKSLTGKFIDSAALTKDAYEDEAEYFRRQFDPVAGVGDKNTQTYKSLLDAIEGSADSAYVKNQYRDALNDAYTELISDTLPDLTDYKTAEKVSEDSEGAQSEPNEERQGWVDRALAWGKEAVDEFVAGMDAVFGGKEAEEIEVKSPTEASKREYETVEWQGAPERSVPSLEDALNDEEYKKRYAEEKAKETAREVQGPAPKPYPSMKEALADEEMVNAFIERKIAEIEKMRGSIGDVQGPEFKSLIQRALEDEEFNAWYAQQKNKPKEVQGPPRPAMLGSEKLKEPPKMIDTIIAKYGAPNMNAYVGMGGDTQTSGDVDLTNDLGKAWFEYKEKGRFNELTKETQDALRHLYAIDGVKAWMGVLGDTEFSQFATEDEAGKTGQEINLVPAEYLYTINTGKLGTLLMNFASKIYDDEFPGELKEDAFMAGIQYIIEANAWAISDAYEREVGDTPVNIYDEYARLHGRSSAAASALNDAISYSREIKRKEEEKRLLSAKEQERNERENLILAREAMITGSYTQEQLDLVEKYAPEMDEAVRMNDPLYKELSNQMLEEWEFGESAWMDEQVLSMAEALGGDYTASTEMDWACRDVAQGYLEDALKKKIDVAYALGYRSLEAYAYSHGGVTLESLQNEARLEMLKLGSAIDDVDMAIIEEAVSYIGTGEDVTAGDIVYSSAAHGFTGAISDPLEAFYNMAAASSIERDSARVKATYDKDYGLFSETQLRSDLYAMVEGGYFPDEQMGNYVRSYLDAGGNPYSLGIMPDDLQFVRKSAVAIKQTQEAYGRWAQRLLNESQGKAFEIGSSISDNMTRMVLSSIVRGARYSSFAGVLFGFGSASYNEASSAVYAQDAQEIKETGVLPKTNTQRWANIAGVAQAVSTATAEYATFGAWADGVGRAYGVGSAVRNGMNSAGIPGLSRYFVGAEKFFKAFAKNEIDEVFIDEIKEGILGNAAEAGVTALRQGAQDGNISAMDALMAGFKGTMGAIVSADDVLKSTVDNAGMMAITVAPMAILGAGGAMRSAMPRSYKAAKQATETGKPEDVGRFIAELLDEANNATQEQMDAANAALHDAAVAEEATVILTSAPDLEPITSQFVKAQEQADAHATSEENSRAAAQEALDNAQAAQERLNNGEGDAGENVTQIANGVSAHAKNSQSTLEHQREKEQKESEAGAAFAQAVQDATARAEAKVSERKARTQERAQIEQRISDLSAQLDDMERSINERFDENNVESPEFEEEHDAYLTLLEEKMELESQLEEMSAVQTDAQNGAEEANPDESERLAAYERMAMAQMETDEMKPVYQTLNRMTVYVDDTQKANILSRTGLKSLPQVNRKYGIKLTNDKSKNAISLDGSFFAEIADLAPGRIAQDVTVAEDALMDIVERKKELASIRSSSRDAASLVDKEARVKILADILPRKGASVQKAPYKGIDGGKISPTPTDGKAKMNPVRTYKRLAKSLGIGQAFGTRKMNGLEKTAAGYYEAHAEYAATGTNFASSIEVMGHEIGHHIGIKLGMTGTPQMVANLPTRFRGYRRSERPAEAFAEFFWRYLLNDDEAKSFAGDAFVADFERRLRKEGVLKDVKKAQKETRRYMLAEADERIRLMVRDKSDKNKDDTLGERFSDSERRFVTQWIDSTRPAEDVNAAVRDAAGGNLLERMNLRNAALMMSTAPRRAFAILTKNLTSIDGTIIGDSLKKRLEDAGLKGNQFDLFIEYMLAKHSLDRDAQRKPVFDRAAISGQDTIDFIKKVEREHPEIARAERAFQEFRHDFMMEYMVNTGYMTQAQLDLFERTYPHYVPTYRVKDRGRRGVGGQTYEIKKATGSTEEIINPMDSFVDMVNTIVAMNLRNETAKTWDRVYQSYEGMGIFGREVDEDTRTQIMNMEEVQEQVRDALEQGSVDDDVINSVLGIIGENQFRKSGTGDVNLPNVLTVQMPDGSRRFYEMFDTELFDMIAGTNDNGQTTIPILGSLTRSMSMLTTGSNPLFFIRNAMRDFQNSVNYGTWAGNYLTGSVRWLRAAWEVARNSGDYEQYQSLGGGGWTRVNPNNRRGADEYRGELFKGYNTSNVGRSVKWAGRKIWNTITASKLNEIAEQASRFAEYKYGRHNRTTAEGRQEAYIASQDVSTDFTRRGNSQNAAVARSVIPFFNASTQGIYRTGRQLTEGERDRAAIRFAKTVINTGITSALASAWLLKALDDDEKEEFLWLSDDLKAKHLYIPNFAPDVLGNVPLIRIPLAQDPLSYAIHGAVTNAMWSGEGEEWAIGVCAIAQNILDSINPVGSTILDPVNAINTNRNWYGSNIVPRRMEGWSPVNQYTEETPGAFIMASETLYAGTGIELSPMMIQYITEQYTGFVGQIAIPFMTKDANTGKINGFKAVVQKARNTLTSDPLKSNDVISCVYDNEAFLTEITKAQKNKRPLLMLNNGLTEREARRAANEAYDLTHSGGAIYEAKKIINAGYDEIDEIEANQSLTDDQKYELTSAVRRDMAEAALDANEEMQAFREAYVDGESFLTRFLTAPTIE